MGGPCLAQIADNLPPFTLSTGWPPSIGIGGRLQSDWVAAFHRNQWPLCLGFRSAAGNAAAMAAQIEGLETMEDALLHFDNGGLPGRPSRRSSKGIATSVPFALRLRRSVFPKVDLVALVLCGSAM